MNRVKEQITVVWVGREERAARMGEAISQRGWYFLPATEMLEALAFYIFYYPDLVVLDDEAGSEVTREVFYHLLTVESPPIIILSDEPYNEAWRGISHSAVQVRPRSTSPQALAEAIHALLAEDETAATIRSTISG